jgi:cytochrome oxidase Cu insertion factor (SCO1/SenC/PrrC family)
MKRLILSLVAVSFLSASVAFGQPNQARSARDGVIQSFDRKSPAVGEQLPDIKAYNAAGEPIRLGELKGNYTVLVFGCLT